MLPLGKSLMGCNRVGHYTCHDVGHKMYGRPRARVCPDRPSALINGYIMQHNPRSTALASGGLQLHPVTSEQLHGTLACGLLPPTRFASAFSRTHRAMQQHLLMPLFSCPHSSGLRQPRNPVATPTTFSTRGRNRNWGCAQTFINTRAQTRHTTSSTHAPHAHQLRPHHNSRA